MMKRIRRPVGTRLLLGVAAAVCVLGGVAYAVTNPFSFVVAHATRVENDLPGTIYFQVDAQAGSCAAGIWLQYTPPSGAVSDQQANVKGAYTLLLAAVSAGARIAIYGNDGATPGNLCVVTSISVLAN